VVCMMIVPDSLKPTAEGLAQMIDPEISTSVFTCQLRPIGGTVGTHWYCGPNVIDVAVIAAIRSVVQSPGFSSGIYSECQPDNIAEEIANLLAIHGLEKMPPSEVSE
jgi:hypothetical protein